MSTTIVPTLMKYKFSLSERTTDDARIWWRKKCRNCVKYMRAHHHARVSADYKNVTAKTGFIWLEACGPCSWAEL